MNKLLIISHTEHYLDEKGIVVGWGSTVTELNHLATIFDEVIHLAPLHKGSALKNAIPYSIKIKYIPLKPSGGKGLQKLSICIHALYNLAIVKKYIKETTIIQFRAPTGIGLYVLPFLKYLNKKPYWVKYAGNWDAKELPLGNKLQRWWLQHKISPETNVTVNGKWQNQSKNIISFENPCLDENDRVFGKKLITKKVVEDKVHYCFIGGLNANKGIEMLVNVFIKLRSNSLGTLNIVGDGVLRNQLENEAKKSINNIVFHGFLAKNSIVEIYKKCHFIVLPSKSEGFPKVIGEAMNYGCVPIVSEVSCINQYIQNNYNGFLISPLSIENLRFFMLESLILSKSNFDKYIAINYKLAEKFTYQNYLERIQKEIIS
mgnify:CR=1 FL=1